jgi:hypothetical protein
MSVANSDVGPYPGNEPTVGSIMFTHYKDFFHTSQLNVARLPDLLQRTNEMHEKYGGDLNRMLGGICLIMSDIPVEPLLNADPARKASVAGLAAASYLLHHPDYKERVQRIIESGEGVMILRIYGELDIKEEDIGPLESKVELFDNWDSYQRFVLPIAKEHGLDRTPKNSSIL